MTFKILEPSLFEGISFDLKLTNKNARKAVNIMVIQNEQIITKFDQFWFTYQFKWPKCIQNRMNELKLEQLVEISCEKIDTDSQFV